MTTSTSPRGVALDYGMFLTYTVEPSGSGFTSEWWVTSRSGMYIRVVAHLSIPIFGSSEQDAWSTASRLASLVADFIPTAWSGEGLPSGKPSPEHVRLHMDYHGDFLGDDPILQTVGYYELLSGFRVNNPAVIIADKMGVPSIRTVQDRIARARKDGLITSFGQGRSHG